MTKGKTLVTKGKSLVTEGKTLVTGWIWSWYPEGKTLLINDQREDLGDQREDLGLVTEMNSGHASDEKANRLGKAQPAAHRV